MTNITFPFFVGPPTEDKTLPLLDAEFRYTTKFVRQLEKSAGSSLYWLLAQGRSVEVLVLLVCYGLKWNKVKRSGRLVEMTEDLAVELIDEYIDAGGDTSKLSDALYEALNASGVYGKPKIGDADPLTQTAAPEPATV